MAFPDRRTSNIVLTILLFAVLLAMVYLARRTIVIFIFAIEFAYLIEPFVEFLQRHAPFCRNLKGPHIVTAYFAILIFLAIVAHGVAPGLSRHAGTLFHEAPKLVNELSTGEVAARLAGKYQWADEQEFPLKDFLLHHREDIQGIIGSMERLTSALIGTIFMVPILAIFFLNRGAQLTEEAIRLFAPSEKYAAVRSLADKLNTMFQSYIRAKVILCGLSFLYCSSATLALGFPYAITLGIAAGILEFIPVAGWMISATTIISIGVLTNSHWIWMAALLGLWRVIMDYWIAPQIVGRELEFHPLLAIFAVMVGGEIGGIVGIYLSIPLVAALRVIWKHSISASAPLQGASGPFQAESCVGTSSLDTRPAEPVRH